MSYLFIDGAGLINREESVRALLIRSRGFWTLGGCDCLAGDKLQALYFIARDRTHPVSVGVPVFVLVEKPIL